MLPSAQPCGACGAPTLVKNFRGADVHVCQHCQRVNLSKADFKTLLDGRPAAHAFTYAEEDFPPTEATDEIDSHLVSTFAATEVDATSAGVIVIDEPTGSRPFDLSAINVGTPAPSVTREVSAYSSMSEEEAFDAELEAYAATKRHRQMGVLLAVGVVTLVLLGVAVVTAGLGYAMTAAEPTAQVAATQPMPAPLPPPESASAPAPVASTSAAPTPAAPTPTAPRPASPKPPPAAAPAPVAPPPPPKPTGPKALVAAGWGKFDQDPAAAEALFAQALVLSPGLGDANYGFGYVLLKRGQKAEAKPYLCRALGNSDAQTTREIRALLSNNALTCE